MDESQRQRVLKWAANSLDADQYDKLVATVGATRSLGRLRFWQEKLVERILSETGVAISSAGEFVAIFEGLSPREPPPPAPEEFNCECTAVARSLFINACVDTVRYWQSLGAHFVTHAKPEKPFIRPWSEIAKQDTAYREVFATLTDAQKAKVIELLEHCVRGAVFSTVCTLDQFPHGEAEIFIWDGVCGEGKRRFRIAPEATDLHDDFMASFQGPKPPK